MIRPFGSVTLKAKPYTSFWVFSFRNIQFFLKYLSKVNTQMLQDHCT